jgi:pseudouridine-5'-phosphate glycosidase
VQAIRLSPRVAEAIAQRQPIVALESSVFAQGLPIPANADAARCMTSAVEHAGAVPAISAVAAGVPTFGIDGEVLARFLARDNVMKVSARDIPFAMLNGRDGATTVAGALAMMALSPIRVFATGGIGGVHREAQFDESADLAELARTPAIVVCAGAKSILDLSATAERLESLGVIVVGVPHERAARILLRRHRDSALDDGEGTGRNRAAVPTPSVAWPLAGDRGHATAAGGARGSKGIDRARARYGARRCAKPRCARRCR